MRSVFADAHYWIAIANPKDTYHARAVQASQDLRSVLIVTTEEALGELVTFFRDKGPGWRSKVVDFVHGVLRNAGVRVLQQSTDSFRIGLDYFRSRLDKDYTLPDCVAMATMRSRGISDVLTSDRHFEQEGFRRLY